MATWLDWMEGKERKTDGIKQWSSEGVKRRKNLTVAKEGVDKHMKCGKQAVNNKLAG